MATVTPVVGERNPQRQQGRRNYDDRSLLTQPIVIAATIVLCTMPAWRRRPGVNQDRRVTKASCRRQPDYNVNIVFSAQAFNADRSAPWLM